MDNIETKTRYLVIEASTGTVNKIYKQSKRAYDYAELDVDFYVAVAYFNGESANEVADSINCFGSNCN